MNHVISNDSDAGAHRRLIIDDDLNLCRLIADFLEPPGYAVTARHTGPKGVAAATAGLREGLSTMPPKPGTARSAADSRWLPGG